MRSRQAQRYDASQRASYVRAVIDRAVNPSQLPAGFKG